jgi:hypothetical protein
LGSSLVTGAPIRQKPRHPPVHPSAFIRSRQTRELMRAVRHSWRVGRDLNHFVVINLPPPANGDELAPQRTFRAIRTKCRSWWDHASKTMATRAPLTDAWTWENRGGVLHVNWLIHIPTHLEEAFTLKLAKWIKAVLPPGLVNYLDTPIYNLNGVLAYILKGTDPATAARFGIDPLDQGSVWGRRACASRGLGRAARDRDWLSEAVVRREWKHRRPSPHATR